MLSNHFVNAAKSLNLQKKVLTENGETNEFKSHISIKMILEKCPEIVPESFKFELVSNDALQRWI